MTAPERFRVDVVQDRPPSGMWHCGPNPSWVTVTHLPTMTQARAYHHSQHKARAAAMACVQMMIEELLVTDDVCNYPEALAASPEVAALIAEARREAEAMTDGLVKASAWVSVAAEVLAGYNRDLGVDLPDTTEIGRIYESRDTPSFRITVGHIRILAAAIRALKETTHV